MHNIFQNCAAYLSSIACSGGQIKFCAPNSTSPSISSLIGSVASSLYMNDKIYAKGVGLSAGGSIEASGSGSSFFAEGCSGAGIGTGHMFAVYDSAVGVIRSSSGGMYSPATRSDGRGSISMSTCSFYGRSGSLMPFGMYSSNGGTSIARNSSLEYFTDAVYAVDCGKNIFNSGSFANNTNNFTPASGALGNNGSLNISS